MRTFIKILFCFVTLVFTIILLLFYSPYFLDYSLFIKPQDKFFTFLIKSKLSKLSPPLQILNVENNPEMGLQYSYRWYGDITSVDIQKNTITGVDIFGRKWKFYSPQLATQTTTTYKLLPYFDINKEKMLNRVIESGREVEIDQISILWKGNQSSIDIESNDVVLENLLGILKGDYK